MEPIQTPDTGTEPIAEPVVPQQPTGQTAQPVDYEKKFKESSKEAQVLAAQLEQERKARQELTNQPTDSELRTAFPQWEFMDEIQKDLARQTLASRKTSEYLRVEREAEKAQARWNIDIEMAIEANPNLSGKEREFKAFCNKPTHKGAPLSALVSAFLYETNSTPSTPSATPRPGLEPGNGGPRTPDKPKQMSSEDLKRLRTTDEKAYLEIIKTHTIDIDSL